MAEQSAIEWTDATWNPVTGCDEVSPGCAHCYAKVFAERFRGVPGHPYEMGFDLTLRPERLDQPLRWRKPRMVFVNSMSDLFHEQVPDDYIARVFNVMAEAPQHIFQVLTKRPERMRTLLTEWDGFDTMENFPKMWPPPNVWLGVSIENRRYVHRADLLRGTPAAVRFISAEPLLGPLVYDSVEEIGFEGKYGAAGPTWADDSDADALDLTDIDWLIVGGESGAGHRPIKEEWVRDLLHASTMTETAFFFKQWGGRTPKAGGRELDGRTWGEFPQARGCRPDLERVDA